MAKIRTARLMMMTLGVSSMQTIGATPSGDRRIGPIAGDTFVGERRDTVLPDDADWITMPADGSTLLDVRLLLETHDKAISGMTYCGMRHGPAAVMQCVNRGEPVDPSGHDFPHLCRVRDHDINQWSSPCQ